LCWQKIPSFHLLLFIPTLLLLLHAQLLVASSPFGI
jgi:hypothetical protein